MSISSNHHNWKTIKKSTPRQNIKLVRRQIEKLTERFDLPTYAPCLCNFCPHFWVSHYSYEGDSDWGCNVKDDYDERIGIEIYQCAKFKPCKDYQKQIDNILISAQRDAIQKIAPYGASIKELQKSIDEKNKVIESSNRELEKIKLKYLYEYEIHLDKIKKLLPADAIVKLTGLSLENDIIDTIL